MRRWSSAASCCPLCGKLPGLFDGSLARGGHLLASLQRRPDVVHGTPAQLELVARNAEHFQTSQDALGVGRLLRFDSRGEAGLCCEALEAPRLLLLLLLVGRLTRQPFQFVVPAREGQAGGAGRSRRTPAARRQRGRSLVDDRP